MARTLYSKLFEPTLFPLLDRLNGTTIARKFNDLLKAERLDRDAILARQEEKLDAAVRYSRRASTFYRDFWAREGARRGLPSRFRALDGLPVVTKADLAAASQAFPIPDYRGRVITTRTSGSTGSPMTFYRSVEQESWFWALRFRMWSWSGYRPGDPYLEINLNPRLAWKKRLQDLLLRCSYLTFNADNQNSRRIVDALRQHRIPHLNGFSSSLFVLARYMLEKRIENPAVIGITSTGDTLHPTYRETIERAFRVRVIDYYGAGGEGFHIASQCEESGTRYHLHPENAVVEILGDEGPVPPGAPGRIVATQLDNEAMPLIRYETGDVGVAAEEDARCSCGRTVPMLERVEGRIPDLVVAPNGAFLVMHFFVVLFKNLQEVDRYQVIQRKRDRLLIKLISRPGANRAAVEGFVRHGVSEATGGSISCEFDWVSEIPLSGAGKRRLVISDFGQDALSVANRQRSEAPDGDSTSSRRAAST